MNFINYSILFIFVIVTSVLCTKDNEVDDRKVEEDDDFLADDAIEEQEDGVEEFIAPKSNEASKLDSFYSYTVKDANGEDVSLSQYKGKISLVVNVASECGYTDNHYKALNKIYNHLSSTGRFTVLAFPCNQFGRQEPGDDSVIQKFVKEQYRVKFPVFGKINVIDNDVPAAWQYLIGETEAPNWNFFKYLVNENGEVLDTWGPWTSVDEIYPVVQEAVTLAMKTKHTEL